jgi:hypothetical protein
VLEIEPRALASTLPHPLSKAPYFNPLIFSINKYIEHLQCLKLCVILAFVSQHSTVCKSSDLKPARLGLNFLYLDVRSWASY